jgi:hypothetical protein
MVSEVAAGQVGQVRVLPLEEIQRGPRAFQASQTFGKKRLRVGIVVAHPSLAVAKLS